MKNVSVTTFKTILENEANNPAVDFINVCDPAEYSQAHIVGVRNVPLRTLKEQVHTFSDKATVYVHCMSGYRGQKAIAELHRLGVKADLVNVEGGLHAWQAAAYPTSSSV